MFVYSIRQLIKYNVHLGHFKWISDNRVSYFFLGLRNCLYIINLYCTLYILKCFIYNVYNLGLIDQRVLVVNNVHFDWSSLYSKIVQNRLWFVNKRWTGGLLTNQKNLYIYNEKLFLNFYKAGYSSLLPSLVFVSNIEMSSSCIYEAIILNISNGSLFDTNLGFYGIFYKLCSNDDSFSVMLLFSRILSKTYLKSFYDKIKILIFNKIKKKRKFYKQKFNSFFKKELNYSKINKHQLLKKNIAKLTKKIKSWLFFVIASNNNTFYNNKKWKPLLKLPNYMWRPPAWWLKNEHKYYSRGTRLFLKKEYRNNLVKKLSF